MKTVLRIFCIAVLLSAFAFSQNSDFTGKWRMLNSKSSFLDYYKDMSVEFTVNKKDVVLITKMGPKRKYEEKLAFTTDGKVNKIEIKDGTFSTNIHMGLRFPLGDIKEVTAVWENNNLKVTEKYTMYASQGIKKNEVTYTYELSPNKDILTCKINRSSRKKGPEMKFVFKRFEDNNCLLYTSEAETVGSHGT